MISIPTHHVLLKTVSSARGLAGLESVWSGISTCSPEEAVVKLAWHKPKKLWSSTSSFGAAPRQSGSISDRATASATAPKATSVTDLASRSCLLFILCSRDCLSVLWQPQKQTYQNVMLSCYLVKCQILFQGGYLRCNHPCVLILSYLPVCSTAVQQVKFQHTCGKRSVSSLQGENSISKPIHWSPSGGG